MEAIKTKLSNTSNCVFGSRTWFDIGIQLFETSNRSEEGRKLWRKYSKLDQKNFERKACRVMWNSFGSLFPNGRRDENTPAILDKAFEIFTVCRNRSFSTVVVII